MNWFLESQHNLAGNPSVSQQSAALNLHAPVLGRLLFHLNREELPPGRAAVAERLVFQH